MTDRACLDHERAVLGVIIRDDPELYDGLGLSESDFAEPVHRAVWRAIGQVVDAGLRPDLLTVCQACNGNASVVASLTDSGLEANVKYHAEQIKEEARKRRVMTAIPRLQDAAAAGPEVFANTLDEIQAELAGEVRRPPRELWRVLAEATRILEDRAGRPGGMIGETCGFRSVDFWTKGFQGGDLIIIAARTSIGKTALALSMARRMKVPVGFISLEMTAEQIGERMIGMEARIQTLSVCRENLVNVVDACTRMSRERKMFVDDSPIMTLAQVRAKARWMYRNGARVLFVDYLTLIRPDENDEAPRHERVGMLAKGLKQLARELNVPIVTLSQINRLGEGQVPGLENLRQSGEIEEDADLIILLHRKRDEHKTLLRVAKNRRGPVGDVELSYEPEYTLFTEIER